jgi:hypothetical protein
MSPPSPTIHDAAPESAKTTFVARLIPYAAPYYLTVAALLGAITVGFVVVTALLVLVAANFNLLGLIE